MENLSDHDLLIRIDERTREFQRAMDNHLKHHFRYALMAWGVTLTALAGLITILIKVF